MANTDILEIALELANEADAAADAFAQSRVRVHGLIRPDERRVAMLTDRAAHLSATIDRIASQIRVAIVQRKRREVRK